MQDDHDDTYIPEPDEERFEPFDARQQSGRRGMIMLLGGFFLLLILAFIVLKLFSSGTRDRNQTPYILAEEGFYKEVPLARGGLETPNQDKQIYEVLNGTTKEEAVSIVQGSEDPMPVPESAEAEITPTVENPVANVVISSPDTQQPVVSTPVTTRPAPSAADHVVQIASLRSRDEADRFWGRFSRKMNNIILPVHSDNIKRVDLGPKGIYYRLRVDGLTDKDSANSLCTRLKEAGQNCIVTRR